MSQEPLSQRWKQAAAIVLVGAAAGSLLAQTPPHEPQLMTANKAFSFDLMHQLMAAHPNANIFVSPFSVSTVLQMTANGAVGETKSEMRRALRTAGTGDRAVNTAVQELYEKLSGRKEMTLHLANGIWVQSGFGLKPAFLDVCRGFYGAEAETVDFNRPDSAKIINDWATRQTEGKIQEVVQFPLLRGSRLVLANAVYFKGAWSRPFKKQLTQPRNFHLAQGAAKPVPMMVQSGSFEYLATAEFAAVKLNYKAGLQMALFLPAMGAKLPPVLAAISTNGSGASGVESGFKMEPGTVTLPKFKLEYDVSLNRPLQNLGMRRAFTLEADFSGLADKPLSISEVRQKSYVDVNEEGTEAAAVTTVTMQSSAAFRSPSQFTLVLDRPFFFVISDTATDTILFMGLVNDPAGPG